MSLQRCHPSGLSLILNEHVSPWTARRYAWILGGGASSVDLVSNGQSAGRVPAQSDQDMCYYLGKPGKSQRDHTKKRLGKGLVVRDTEWS